MAFDYRNFQDKILENAGRSLFDRYNFLRKQFNEAIIDLSRNSGIEDGAGRIVNGLKWIYKNHTKRRAAITLRQDTWDARKVLNRHGALLRESNLMGRNLTEEDLIKAGLDEANYFLTLERVLNFIAWAYNIQIYEAITEMINESGRSVRHSIPEEELNRIGLESFVMDNKTPRILVAFIIDNALYMDQKGCLAKLDEGLTELIEEVRTNSTLSYQLELYIATTGNGPKEVVNFDTIDHLESQLNEFMIQPFGRSKMASTIELALQRLDERIQQLRSPEINLDLLNCPWMIVLSNGKFAEDMTAVSDQLQERISQRKLMVYWRALSHDANMEVLSQLPAQDSGKVKVLEYVNGFFKDINNSLKSASCSVPGYHVDLENKSGFVED